MRSLFSVDFTDIGRQIKQRRQELGLTQEQVADQLEITPTQLSRIECGQRPSLTSLLYLTTFLNMSLDELFNVYISADHTFTDIHHSLLEFTPEERRQFLRCIRCFLEQRKNSRRLK